MPAEAVDLGTPAKRRRLEKRRNPYWVGVSGGRGGVSLGYRTGARGPGCWIGKAVADGRRSEERLALADDAGADDSALGYSAAVAAALAWAKRAHAAATTAGKAAAPVLTVQTAIEAYTERRASQSIHGRDAASRLRLHVLANDAFADTRLRRLSSADFEIWRKGLSTKLKPQSVNRLLNDLRAALNAAVEMHWRQLPAHLPLEIRVGTKAAPNATETRRQLLSDDEVRRLVTAGFKVDETGDFGRLILILAATGARFSQASRLVVGDVQIAAKRLMMPASSKGRGQVKPRRLAVPVDADVIARLEPCLIDRAAGEPLLLRWTHRQTGPTEWVRVERQPWRSSSEASRHWSRALAKASVEKSTVMYAMRHSSIVRGLQAGLSIRMVAALHDTSTAMIERHYSAHILDAGEELARRATLSMVG